MDHLILVNISNRLDDNGIVTRVNYNNQVRDSVFQAQSVNEVKVFYKALALFDKLAYKNENHIEYKLKEGDIFVFSFSISMLICPYSSQANALYLTTSEFCMGEKDTPLRLAGSGTCKVSIWIGTRSTAK